MNRRSFLRALLTGVAGSVLSHELDIDRLLWVPGQKTIFLPSQKQIEFFSEKSPILPSEIFARELERIAPHLLSLFERDETFYRIIGGKK